MQSMSANKEHVKKLANGLQGISGRSAKILHNAIKLSDSQYTSKMRFLMEILQNCDDNFYENPDPYVEFELLDKDPTDPKNPGGALRVENNEIGKRLIIIVDSLQRIF